MQHPPVVQRHGRPRRQMDLARNHHDIAPGAAQFARRIRSDRPRLTNGLRFDASPRHRGYVDSDAFVAYLDRTAVEFGWTLPAGGGVSR